MADSVAFPGCTGVVCVMPALDAAASVARVATGLRRALPGAALVAVDDGSRDRTRAVLSRVCDEVIGFERNRGKGAALRAAFELAARSYAGRAVLTIDADGQHDPEFAPGLLAALADADVVIGARHIAAVSVPPHRRLANRLSTAAARAVTGTPFRDSQSGFRAIRPEVLGSVRATGDRYEFETDFLVRASRAGFRIAEVPVPTIYGPPSHFRELADAWRVARVLWQHRAAAFR